MHGVRESPTVLPLSFCPKERRFTPSDPFFHAPRLTDGLSETMSIDAHTVQHVARLARLQMPTEVLQPYAEQLSRILALMESLDTLPTEGVTPMSHAVDMDIMERRDQVQHGNQQESLLACAPDTEQGHFRVPKIIE